MPTVECGFDQIAIGTGPEALVSIGPTISVDIGFDPDHDYRNSTPGARPESGATQVPALIDTGATLSCIDKPLADQLSLTVVDRQQIGGVGGRHTVDVYLAHIHFPLLQFTQYGLFHGVSLSASGQIHRALIGRSFLRAMMMIYDGRTGKVQVIR